VIERRPDDREDRAADHHGLPDDAWRRARPASLRERLAVSERLVTPLVLFVALYIATMLLLAWIAFPFIHWAGLICVLVATSGTIALIERGRWDVGLLTSPRRAAGELAGGIGAGVILISACAALVAATTDLAHQRGSGFPWQELAIVFIPAVVHEELLFRGYPFQKLRLWRREAAILLTAAVFAALHSGNAAVTWLGLANIFLGGILLALAYERHARLWFPIGLHLAWNLMTGPVLGHEVSGYTSMKTLFIEIGDGPVWLTGGDFGIEGSIWMTLVEVVGIIWLARTNRRVGQALSHAS
jgi:uncharacterized protein